MERTGRPGKGSEHAERVSASSATKERLKVILQTMEGTRTVAEACEELSLSATRFQQLRREALQGAAEALEPRKPGRPARTNGESESEAAWRARCRELERALEVAELRERLAREDLAEQKPREEKGGARSKKERRKRRTAKPASKLRSRRAR